MKDKIIAYFMKRMKIEVATVAVISKNGKVLLTKRNNVLVDGGKWCLPGGHVNKWEKAEDCVKREIKEEIGFDTKKVKLLFVHEEFVKRLKLHAVVFVYSLDLPKNQKLKKNWEVLETRWFSKKDAMKLNLAFTHKEILKKFFKEFGGKK